MEKEACSVRYLMEDRDKLAGRFLASVGWKNAETTFLAGDASFRRYKRLTLKKRRAILMDAPPPVEDVRPFIRITKHLNGLGYSVPEIMAKDINSGFLLLEDMGDVTYTNVLAKGANEKEIYSSAIDVLVDLHCREPQVSIPNEIERYDESKLLNEAALFVDWYLKFIFPESVLSQLKLEFLEIWTDLISNLDFGRETLVLRDFHADNLMWLPDRTGIQKCGLLDYQDAVSGHPAYDIMSLIQDARRDLQQGLPADLLSYYHSQSQAPDRGEFELSYMILSAQRHCKVIGIFSRLAIRDGKHQYLSHISRCWELLKATCLSSELIGLNNWLAKNVPVESSIVIDKIIS